MPASVFAYIIIIARLYYIYCECFHYCFISVCESNNVQILSDVLLFASHPDPQLRGITSSVIGCLLHSALVRSGGNFGKWVETECKWRSAPNEISVPELIKLLLKVSLTL